MWGSIPGSVGGSQAWKTQGHSDWSPDTQGQALGNDEPVKGELGRNTSLLTEKWSNERGMKSSHLLFRKTTLVAFCSLNSRDEDS